jgi:hypothetical protein
VWRKTLGKIIGVGADVGAEQVGTGDEGTPHKVESSTTTGKKLDDSAGDDNTAGTTSTPTRRSARLRR